ncbi:MAG TPA: hypothetical protein PK413_06460, partial [Thermoanaerobaculia bacterium]|nr:hypothetical protein [Thermoanaerobaculia bacterium]
GRNVTRNDNDKFQLNARLTYQPFGDTKYSEGDFESADKPLLAVSLEYESNERPVAAAGSTPAHSVDREIVGEDVSFKYKGLSIFVEHFDATNDRSNGVSDFDEEYLIGQVGYFVVPKTFEVALRFATLDPNKDKSNDDREERGLVLGYFFNKHAHKLQADYRQIEDKSTKRTDDEIRIQYQIIF